MDYLEQPYHHFHAHQHQHDPYALGMVTYPEQHHNMHDYANVMALQQSGMMGMPNPKINETKPRLGKDEVEILEKEFQRNPKPTTQTKRAFADDMGVDLSRINNWFQNRRAKRKQEKKQEAYELSQQQDGSGYRSEPSSPDWNAGDHHPMPLQHASTFPAMSGPPPAAAPCNPQYEDPTMASQESLQRTLAAAQNSFIPQTQDFQHRFQEPHGAFHGFHGFDDHSDSAQFPSVEQSVSPYDSTPSYSYSSASIAEFQPSPINHTPASYQTYPNASDAQGMNAFPSQLLPPQAPDAFQPIHQESESPEPGHGAMQAIGFKFENMDDVDDSSPPAPTIPFKSPPPMDIASRRKKVAVRPAALTSDTMKSRPPAGPRTISHGEGFRRQSDSPMASPMRRVLSAGGCRTVMSGRISKSGYGEHSPINLGGFSDAGSFMQHNSHTTRPPPSLTAGSSLNSSLAPPTPMSPRGGEMTLAKREDAVLRESPPSGELSYMFNDRTADLFTPIERDPNLESPPETPQANMALNSYGNGWANDAAFQESQWNFDAADAPLYTPGHDAFPPESLQMHPNPAYLNTTSQPVTPALGQQFNPAFMFAPHDSMPYKQESQYGGSNQAEYTFADAQYASLLSTSPSTQQKQFQFSNQTPADFSERKS